jgi:hypothetical protein
MAQEYLLQLYFSYVLVTGSLVELTSGFDCLVTCCFVLMSARSFSFVEVLVFNPLYLMVLVPAQILFCHQLEFEVFFCLFLCFCVCVCVFLSAVKLDAMY